MIATSISQNHGYTKQQMGENERIKHNFKSIHMNVVFSNDLRLLHFSKYMYILKKAENRPLQKKPQIKQKKAILALLKVISVGNS